MGLIEQAARRLEELRRAGIEPPSTAPAEGSAEAEPPAPPTPSAPHIVATPKRPADSAASRARRVQLDLAGMAAVGILTPDQPHSRLANELRILKRPLIANAFQDGPLRVGNGNLVVVTSSLPGEGKTFVALNLAMSIASELDKTVLLVDADVAQPSLPMLLGVPESPGLLDVLIGKSSLEDAIVRTNVERLAFLPAGAPRPHSSELLASEAMARLLEELGARYSDRLVLFDSPPVLATTEARVLATQMGQVIFVVKAESTLRSQVEQALAAVESCPVKLVVLNGSTTPGEGHYGYGYGYGHGPGAAPARGPAR